jgi:hypothetical protein
MCLIVSFVLVSALAHASEPDMTVKERTVVWREFVLLDHGDLSCMTTQRSPARLLGVYNRDGRVASINKIRILSGPQKGCEGYVRTSSLDWYRPGD